MRDYVIVATYWQWGRTEYSTWDAATELIARGGDLEWVRFQWAVLQAFNGVVARRPSLLKTSGESLVIHARGSSDAMAAKVYVNAEENRREETKTTTSHDQHTYQTFVNAWQSNVAHHHTSPVPISINLPSKTYVSWIAARNQSMVSEVRVRGWVRWVFLRCNWHEAAWCDDDVRSLALPRAGALTWAWGVHHGVHCADNKITPAIRCLESYPWHTVHYLAGSTIEGHLVYLTQMGDIGGNGGRKFIGKRTSLSDCYTLMLRGPWSEDVVGMARVMCEPVLKILFAKMHITKRSCPKNYLFRRADQGGTAEEKSFYAFYGRAVQVYTYFKPLISHTNDKVNSAQKGVFSRRPKVKVCPFFSLVLAMSWRRNQASAHNNETSAIHGWLDSFTTGEQVPACSNIAGSGTFNQHTARTAVVITVRIHASYIRNVHARCVGFALSLGFYRTEGTDIIHPWTPTINTIAIATEKNLTRSAGGTSWYRRVKQWGVSRSGWLCKFGTNVLGKVGDGTLANVVSSTWNIWVSCSRPRAWVSGMWRKFSIQQPKCAHNALIFVYRNPVVSFTSAELTLVTARWGKYQDSRAHRVVIYVTRCTEDTAQHSYYFRWHSHDPRINWDHSGSAGRTYVYIHPIQPPPPRRSSNSTGIHDPANISFASNNHRKITLSSKVPWLVIIPRVSHETKNDRQTLKHARGVSGSPARCKSVATGALVEISKGNLDQQCVEPESPGEVKYGDLGYFYSTTQSIWIQATAEAPSPILSRRVIKPESSDQRYYRMPTRKDLEIYSSLNLYLRLIYDGRVLTIGYTHDQR
ncbi:hypothetical protein BDY19DRAFT_907713 [Irpex rosettiformis]|uniref:Uncharacterized protein n=1 Tax=Irpex rosettiformis TaxID=378272 RepID=A0ACB8TYV5_9APHY|nr:hypothetical protein BDY19DRAFT_907713 [Irpex rosettiformis]